MNSEPTPLDLLPQIFAPAKVRLAKRLVWEGGVLDPARFTSRGFGLKPSELAAIAAWNARDLETRRIRETVAADGTRRFVLLLSDGETVETVAMPTGTVCVSSQAGCAVGCRFCASGRDGVKRNLLVHEILEQVVHARRLMPVRRVVFMGMGEPTQNLDFVLDAIERLRDDAGIGASNQVLSTVGSVAALDRISLARVRPCLALSLHSAIDEKRRDLLVRAPRDSVKDLVQRADRYGRETKNPIQIEWTLLEGVNDGEDEVQAVRELLRGVRACLNFIVYNPVEGFPFRPTSEERMGEIVRDLRGAGLFVTVRHSLGRDADAACGQLRRRAAEERPDRSPEAGDR